MKDIEIRDLRLDDIHTLLPVHKEAFSGTMGIRLGDQYLIAFLKWFITSQDTLALAAVKNNCILGYVFGGPIGYSQQMNRDLIWVIGSSLLSRPWLIFNRHFFIQIPARLKSILGLRQNGNTTDGQLNNAYSLVGIGVNPLAQRQGIGSMLIRSFVNKVIIGKYSHIRLTVHYKNQAARAFYEKHGWTVLRYGQYTVIYYIKTNN